MSEFSSFLTATARCVEQCKDMLSFEKEKRQALLSDNMARLENMIQAQQAAIMRLESLEKQRLEAQDKAGYHDLSAEEILALLDEGPDKEAFAQNVSALKQTMEDIRYHNDTALRIARANLKIIDSVTEGKAQQEKHGVYRPSSANGAKFKSSPSFETKI